MSIQAIEPPPAPIVLTATQGMLTGMPHATWNSLAYCSSPSSTRPMSQLVPPMSSENADGLPAAAAK